MGGDGDRLPDRLGPRRRRPRAARRRGRRRCCRRRGAPPPPGLGGAAVLLLAGLLLDRRVGGLRLPTWHRQVDERWLARYRGWVYGLGFGAAARRRRGHRRDERDRLRHRACSAPCPAAFPSAWRSARCSVWPGHCRWSGWPGPTTARDCTASSGGWSTGRPRADRLAQASLATGGRRAGRGGCRGRDNRSEGADVLVSRFGLSVAPRAGVGHPDLPPRGRHGARRGHPPGAARLHPGAARRPGRPRRRCRGGPAAAGRVRRPGRVRLRRRRARPVRAAGRAAPGPVPVRPGPAPARRPRPQRGAALLHRGGPGLLPVRRPGQPRPTDGAGAPGPPGWSAGSPSPTGRRCWRGAGCRERARPDHPRGRPERAARGPAGPPAGGGEPARLPGPDGGRRLGAGGRPPGLRTDAATGVLDHLRSGEHRRQRVLGLLLHGEQGRQRLPPGHVHRGVVEGRRLLVVLRRLPLLHRLQRQVRRVLQRLRRRPHLRPDVLELLVRPGLQGHLRPAPALLQRVPLRPVQHPRPVQRRGRTAGW